MERSAATIATMAVDLGKGSLHAVLRPDGLPAIERVRTSAPLIGESH
jgi:hypothetical protein